MTERKLIPMESGSSEKESGKINEELPNTNRILLQFPSEGLKSYILYIPAYMRLEIRQIQEISL